MTITFIWLFEWPTARLVQEGHALQERDIWLYDVLPIIVAGYLMGFVAMMLTRFLFPRARSKPILISVGVCAGAVGLLLIHLSLVIAGRMPDRDIGSLGMILMIVVGVATWSAIRPAFAEEC
ncbi:hypothetical protein GJW-30_1_00975 [Variibacter gotjawalensis]|uniref:Uncharacterized protein n=1 Tax=Variibacter gotjawalensis TaxID=1333996 RepID=A0A0S3PR64_9BRAD|nr:hypothetical protein [Variibacter gotjawalensis]NIK48755.1 hypothetical protein [Variibacter gotjawalensis]RZS50616.1 hypothetical protein EV661_3082 [Variibacter gotjawalensis]BAT58450.1 hypothetical protein GJW-30_1_00975 [Variibacter gotjawalensis]